MILSKDGYPLEQRGKMILSKVGLLTGQRQDLTMKKW